MKCHNCGFESETNFCPRCGAKLESQPQPSVPFTQNIPNTQTQNKNQNNPYVQNYQQAQPNIQTNPYAQPSQPVHQNIPNNTYTQNQPNLPTTNNMQPATPTAIHPKKTSGKATGGIVAAAILGAVILLGTIIFSYSCVSDVFMQEKENTPFEFERDFINHNTSDIVQTSYGSITLKSIEDVLFVAKPEDVPKEESYNTNAADFEYQYKITFSIENTSEKAITVSADDFSVSYDSQNSDTECPKITKSENPLAQSVTLNSGEKKDFSIYHYASSEAFRLNAEYRYADEDKNKKYLIKFSDYIEYRKTEVGVGNLTVHPMELPLCSLTLTDAVQTDVKGDAKIYSFTFYVRNDTAENIEISSNDFAIYAYKDYFASINKSNKHICTVSKDETIDIKANNTDLITVSFEIPNDCSTLFVYYKLNNHITNPDKAVGDKNYSIYGMIDPL